MAISFRQVVFQPLREFDAAAPDGAVIGVVGEDHSGKSALLRLAAGMENPAAGKVEAPASRRLIGPGDALNLAPVALLLLDQTLARHDLLVRERVVVALDRLRRTGTTTLVVSHEEDLLRRLCDEIWWLRDGKLVARGAPEEVLGAYRKHLALRTRAWGDTVAPPLSPRLRRGAVAVGIALAVVAQRHRAGDDVSPDLPGSRRRVRNTLADGTYRDRSGADLGRHQRALPARNRESAHGCAGSFGSEIGVSFQHVA